jgi:hypothetical protein
MNSPRWPPERRRRVNDENQPPSTPQRSSVTAPTEGPSPSLTPVQGSRAIRGEVRNKKQHRNGFETQPKALSFIPYSVNTPGRARSKPFAFENYRSLEALEARTGEDWNDLALREKVLEPGRRLREYQIEAANFIISRSGDLCVVAPTGAGKSLVWLLPLLAQQNGVSLVVIPFTSLGFQGDNR